MPVPVEINTEAVQDGATEPSNLHLSSTKAVRALSPAQERKLVDHLEDRFLDITRNYKKRSDPSSTLATLSAYLEATHHLLFLILQIPPVDPSAPLRTSLLLRLTGEVLSSIPGYVPDMETLPLLLAYLTDLDHGWLAVLRGQAWDADASAGVDAELPDGARASRMSQTERTRLRSLLLGGTDAIEEWMEKLDTQGLGFEVVLQRVGLEQSFNDLFSETLSEMGSLAGENPQGMIGTC
ncbi:hypothetical protein OH76DRAFT_1406029 [Lentinus brumalis]|uniref:Uncharacterized protein n=1 Tax=Lentinus brumalis TaxID=2498619 RepID=A0A371D4G2_9APHY|nr:hypothetical protein OH76DRAFT_1406029 [Polyporus brumalis]